MNKKTFKITCKTSEEIEQKFYILRSYESLLSVLCKSYFEMPSEDYRNMIEDYRKSYQKAYVEFSYVRDSLFYKLIGSLPSWYKFDFDKYEVACEW